MKKILIVIAIVVVAVVMAKTVPDKKAHKEAMMEAVRDYVDEEAENRGLGNNVLTKLGKGIVNKTVEIALNSKLDVDDYFLFNTTHVEIGDEKKTLSLGMFGHVFTFNKQMLRDALESAARDKAAAKQEAKDAKAAAKEKRRMEKQLRKEQKRREKEARREQKRKEKERRRLEKEAKRKAKKKGSV